MRIEKSPNSSLEWKELSSKEILKTKVFTVLQTESLSPEGQTGNYIVMDTNDWVITIPVVDDCFLMVEQWRHGEQKTSIEFPGGVIEKDETPQEGAARELKEETGCISKNLVYLGSMNPNPALMKNHVHFFAAYELENCGKQNLDSDEYINVLKLPQDEVYEKLGTEKFQHALMASAISFFRQKKMHP